MTNANETTSNHRQLCTFLVDGLSLGIDVTQVQEVLKHQDTTPVPLAPAVVGGLINLRGQIVTALDLRRRLGAPPRPADTNPMNVVVRHTEGVVSFLVDEIGDVVDVDDALFEPPPETLPATSKALVRGVYKLEKELLLLLDTDLAMRVAPQEEEERSQHGQR